MLISNQFNFADFLSLSYLGNRNIRAVDEHTKTTIALILKLFNEFVSSFQEYQLATLTSCSIILCQHNLTIFNLSWQVQWKLSPSKWSVLPWNCLVPEGIKPSGILFVILLKYGKIWMNHANLEEWVVCPIKCEFREAQRSINSHYYARMLEHKAKLAFRIKCRRLWKRRKRKLFYSTTAFAITWTSWPVTSFKYLFEHSKTL